MTTTVLIAEDSIVVRAVLRRHLETAGYLIIEADDGLDALALARATLPDVVLLDIEMPGLNGYEVLAAMQADPQLGEVPVVFLTGRSGADDLVEALRLGAHDYLRKPFEAGELIARVSAAARMKALQDELRRRNDELAAIGRTDALTGLSNRRHLEERLREVAAGARRHGFTLGVVMLDIDHFKLVNDSLGHAGGDAILREFATRLTRELRDDDVSGRWGGEEFLLLLPHTDLDGTVRLSERVREAVGSESFNLEAHGAVAVTVSCGCAVGDGFEPEEQVKRADEALYEAKEAGRNCVVAR